ncbi:hypothetical protein SAMN05216567_10117 [Variovorax sp. OK605]|uniref:DUF7673 family protein n=1 Tax=Variovorax sp. OK605 TaxID=1855317 RepID=UPI0008F3B757|nr:hypothetical protein [Variovorax sp. OK605]SFO51296.1 hypothetical protein SAMN05216567_10117 [Variovorax sp. OK605]
MNTAALIKLWNVTQVHQGTSGARAAAGVLLGLYNGSRFPFDLTDLRVLDNAHLEAAITVINDDAGRCQMEVHAWLNRLTGRRDFGQRFEHLAHEWKHKGKCKREYLDVLEPAHLTIVPPTPAAPPGTLHLCDESEPA